MTTTVNFNLSSILSGNLSGSNNGANVYAFAYDNGTLVQTAKILLDGSTTGTTPSLTLNRIASGKIYVVVQQTDTTAVLPSPADLPSVSGINAVGFFTPTNAQKYNFRYDLVELNLQSNPADVADISDINQFGMPITLTVNGQTRGFKVSGDTIAADIRSQSPVISGTNLQDQAQYQFAAPGTPLQTAPGTPVPRDTIVPGNNLAPNPFPGSDWSTYVNQFTNHVGDVEILTTFDGVPSKNLKGSLSDYLVKYDAAHQWFWLYPNPETEHLAGMTTGWIKIPLQGKNSLQENIYLQTGQLEVYLAGPDSPGKMIKTYSSFTPNNAWGDISKMFVAGFDAGFWGSTGISPNSGAGANFDLDHTWNWDAAYAYAAVLGQGSYARDWGAGGAGQPGQGNRYYDPFGAEFFKNSNAYGYSYTDLISNGGGVSPAIPVANAQGVNVSTIDVMLWDRSETPTGYTSGNSGYVAGPYSAANQVIGSNFFQFDFHFALNSQTLWPNNETPIVFKFYDPTATGTTGPGGKVSADGWVWFTLPKNDWYSYTISQSGTTYSMTPGGSSGQVGLFNLSGVPVASGSGISWYQLLVGDASDYTTYNFYATVDGSNIMNSAVMDHGVTVGTMAPATGYKFVFADGGTMHYDIHTFLAPHGLPPGAPGQPAAPSIAPPQAPPPAAMAAPLIGTLVDGIFVQIGDGSYLKQGDLAFSFSTSGYANTLIPGHIAKIDLGNLLHSDWILTPLVTMAGFDGDDRTQRAIRQWHLQRDPERVRT